MTIVRAILANIDFALASSAQRREAKTRFNHALAVHGANAEVIISQKLRDPRRRKSKRSLRIALADLQGHASNCQQTRAA